MKLFLGDCVKTMRENIEGHSVDLVVTSPPYDNLRDYEKKAPWGAAVWQSVIEELARVVKMGGVVVWIINDATINGSETGSLFKQALYFKYKGFLLHDTMIWYKGASPYQDKNRYISAFEYMFVFSNKRPPKTANLIKDRKNNFAGNAVHGSGRRRDGRLVKSEGAKVGKKIKEFGSRLNVWEMPSVKSRKVVKESGNHPAIFPQKLAEDHIETWSDEWDVVLDPFMGSGTTCLAAKSLNREFIGCEINEKYFNTAKGRLL